MTDFDIAAYAANLRRIADQKRIESEQRLSTQRKHVENAEVDYLRVIRSWWYSMSPKEQSCTWSMESIVAIAFKGEARRPALRLVASALRKLGFSSERDWTRAGRNRRYWKIKNR